MAGIPESLGDPRPAPLPFAPPDGRPPKRGMSSFARGWYVVKLMMVEEYRHHTSYSGKWGFTMFPLMMFFFFFVLAGYSSDLFDEIPYTRVVLILHGSAFFYGMSMGAFAFFGREYVERRFGRRNFIITTPVLLPVQFRETFTAYYIHDIIFYMGIALGPFVAALVASMPLSGISAYSVAKTAGAGCLSFMVGISFSFFMSSLYMRSIRGFLVATFVAAAAVGITVLGMGDLMYMLPGWAIQTDPRLLPMALGLAYFVILSWAASLLIVESSEVRSSQTARVDDEFSEGARRWSWLGPYGPIVAKELIDMRRWRMAPRLVFSFVLPLFMISVFSWIVNKGAGIPLEFNIIFYGSMVGFFGMLIYTWLNNTEEPDYYDFLPVNVPFVIKAKLLVWFFVTSGISTAFVVSLAIFLDQLSYLPLALFVMFTTSVYVVTATAYLTGLRPHTALFSFWVMVRFNIMAFIPLVSVFMMSMTLEYEWYTSTVALLVVGGVISVSTVILLKGIDEKWARERFAT